MNRQFTSLLSGIVIAGSICISPTSFADPGFTVSSSHKGVPMSQRLEAAASCVREIEEMWRESAGDPKLMLKNRARVRTENDQRIFTIDGWVWAQGERILVSHECRVADGSHQVALAHSFPDHTQLASY